MMTYTHHQYIEYFHGLKIPLCLSSYYPSTDVPCTVDIFFYYGPQYASVWWLSRVQLFATL